MVGHLITLKGRNTMSKLVKVAETKDVTPGTGKVVEAEGRSIALFNVAGTFHAIDNTCTHMGGPLGEGELTGEVVTCPWHGAQFNVKTREVLAPPARTGVRSFPVQVQGDDVLVELD
jgi:nitrite reductase (NADH) small subunit/3-phenylpropionate/trans-cinnamate dioxygenase ferredoxin subunit